MTNEQAVAYRAVRAAIARGDLIRPESCSRCGFSGLASDGRSMIQAHHHDYNRPLDVEWICAKCHRKETPLPEVMGAPAYGEVNGQSKLTAKIVAEIKASSLSGAELGRIYGVDRSTINKVRRGVYWNAATPEQKK